jgi:hypothetical protein
VLSPESHEAGRLCRESIRLAKLGQFDEAVSLIDAMPDLAYGQRECLMDEALLGIVTLCCKANQIERATKIAKMIGMSKFQKRAFEILEQYASK